MCDAKTEVGITVYHFATTHLQGKSLMVSIFFTVCKQIVNSGTIIYSTHVQEKIVLKIVEYWLGMKVTLAYF